VFYDRRIRHPHMIVALMLIGLASCQPMPEPFARGPGASYNPLLQLKDRSGIVVLPLDGAPPGIAHEILSATIAALHDLNIPATMRSANTKSHFLVGHVETKTVRSDLLEVELIWELADPKGVRIGQHLVTGTVSNAAWNTGSDKLVRQFAVASARGVAAFIQSPSRYKPVPIAALRPFYVMGVAGVSAKLGGILRRAMVAALHRLKLSVQPVRRERDLVIAGRVSLGPIAAGVRRIEIYWSVRKWNGEEIGNLKQANLIAADLMGEKWPELAKITTEAAAPGVVEVLRNFRPAWGG